MTLQVRVSSRAERDVDMIFEWLAELSRDGAIRWYETYLKTLRSLADQATGCARAPEAERVGLDLQQVLFRTRRGRLYRSLFIIRDNAIHVLAVRGPGQNRVTEDDLGVPE